MKVERRPGRFHNYANGVSRIPCNQCMQWDLLIQGSLDLKTLQEDDKDIALIRGWLEKGEKPGPAGISSESYAVNTLMSQ